MHLAIVVATAFATVGAAAWLAPRVSGAVAAWVAAPPVTARTVALPGALPLQANVSASAAASQQAGRDATPASSAASPGASAPVSPVMLDAGVTFSMIGFTCDTLVADGDVVLTLRTSRDGAHWSDWYTTDLLSDRRRRRQGAPVFHRAGMDRPGPLRAGRRRPRWPRRPARGAARGRPKLVAIDTDGGGGAKEAVLGVVRSAWPPSRRSA